MRKRNSPSDLPEARRQYRSANKTKIATRRKRYDDAHRTRIRELHNAGYKSRRPMRKIVDNEHRAVWRADRHGLIRQFLREYKLRMGCVDCGYSGHFVALDFDHIDRSAKTNNMSQINTFRQVVRELPNCEVRCANCHRVKTFLKGDAFHAKNARRHVN